MERLAFRGGPYYDGAGAGLFTLGLYVARTMRIQYRGFRPAFARCVGSLMVMVMRTEQGQKGGRFRPRRRENISSPTRPVDNESGVGHLSLRWSRANREWLNYGAAG